MAAKKASKKRPRGWKAFDDLTRALVQVPKEEVDAQIEAGKRQRKAERRKKQ